jgi:tetratricopeptide (TPR) repeat protein
MGKLADKFVEWALQKNRWPLLLPLFIPLLFKALQAYCSLSFKETVGDWRFRVATGIVLLVSVGLYIALRVKQSKSSTLPQDRLVVAIARFYPSSRAAADDAKNIPHRIEQKLEELRAKGAPLEIKRLKTKVEGATVQARREKAIALGSSGSDSAHVVLWGEVRKDEGQLFVLPRLTVVRQSRGIQIEERQLSNFTSDEPIHLAFKERLAEEIADILILIYGLAYYKLENWDKTIEILSQADTKEAYLYKAHSFFTRASQAAAPRQDLAAALENYQKVMESLPSDLLDLTDNLTWRAYVGVANVFAAIGTAFPTGDDQEALREAVTMYRNAIENYPVATISSQEWINIRGIIQNNLGATLHLLGTGIKGEEGVQLLREAVAAFKAIRSDFNDTSITTLFKSENNLGKTLRDLAIRVEGAESVRLLRDAVKVYEYMLPVLSNYKYLAKLGVKNVSPEVFGNAQTNFGAVQYDLGTRLGGHEGKRYLNNAIDCFNNALSIFDSTKEPTRHAEILAYKNMIEREIRA